MIKGFKVFNPDWTCRGFKFEVGKTYEHEGNIEMCGKGFHFCQKASDCFNYYSFDSNNKVAEVEAVGLRETKGDKSVTDKIKIVREISWQEMLTIVNIGKNCTGYRNSGDRNSGDRNGGDRNSGDRNSGNWNGGNWNSGDWNSGNRNSGDCNSGNWNSGDWNSGDRNSGNWNSGDRNSGNWNGGNWNSGFFNTKTPKIMAFNKRIDMEFSDFAGNKGVRILNCNFENNIWIYSANMTEQEKLENPTHETTGGYLKTLPFKEACKLMWGNLTDEEKALVREIPNFDEAVFEEITGIKI